METSTHNERHQSVFPMPPGLFDIGGDGSRRLAASVGGCKPRGVNVRKILPEPSTESQRYARKRERIANAIERESE